MKVHSKMVVSSSPGWPEKVVQPPPPLTKVLSRRRSCGRSSELSHSRSSPMFVAFRVKDKVEVENISDGVDPASPKVTCIGQVRIKKKKKKKVAPVSKKKRSRRAYCRCLQGSGALFCYPLFSSVKSRLDPPRWVLPSCWWGDKKKVPRTEDTSGEGEGGGDSGEEEREQEKVAVALVEEKEQVFVPTTPPKNALLLMRCRSAPHRTSSFIATVSFPKEANAGPLGAADIAGEVGNQEEGGCSVVDGCVRRDDEDAEEKLAAGLVGPIKLTRCNSEPAAKSPKLIALETNSSSIQGSVAIIK